MDERIKHLVMDLEGLVEALKVLDLNDTSVRELEYLQNYTYGATQVLQELTDEQYEKEEDDDE